MSFFNGRASFRRFKLAGQPPRLFDETQLELLAQHAAGRSKYATSDGVDTGWSATGHVLDTEFTLEKNVINECLYFALRVDAIKLPADMLKAYYETDLKALCANNPSGKPSSRQKREAREAARERLEHESKDGRYLKRKAFECLWDLKSNELLFSGPTGQVGPLISLFRNTFGVNFDSITAGKLAFDLAEPNGMAKGVDDATPSAFVPGLSPKEYAWCLDENSREFLGNEFLLWLWWLCDTEAETLTLSDGSEAVLMPTSTLSLACPRGQTGKESFTHEGPTRLPEARRAIQSGKMPRSMGMTIVRHGEQIELKLAAETLAIGGLKIPKTGEEDERAQLDSRVNQLREAIQTVDLIYGSFIIERTSANWNTTLKAMQRWLGVTKESPAHIVDTAKALKEMAATGMGMTGRTTPRTITINADDMAAIQAHLKAEVA